MPEERAGPECSICRESLKFYNSLDCYFHFLRHYNQSVFLAGSRVEV